MITHILIGQFGLTNRTKDVEWPYQDFTGHGLNYMWFLSLSLSDPLK